MSVVDKLNEELLEHLARGVLHATREGSRAEGATSGVLLATQEGGRAEGATSIALHATREGAGQKGKIIRWMKEESMVE